MEKEGAQKDRVFFKAWLEGKTTPHKEKKKGAMREGAGGGKEEGNGTGATRSPKGPLDMQNAIEAIEAARKAAAKKLLETVERDKRFQSICKKTSNKALQKVYKRVTKYETQAHNKEWILSKMAKFILEEMLVLPRKKMERWKKCSRG